MDGDHSQLPFQDERAALVNGIVVRPPSATVRAFMVFVDTEHCHDDVEIEDVLAAVKQWKKDGSRFKITIVDADMVVFEVDASHVTDFTLRLAERFIRDELRGSVSASSLSSAVAAYVPPKPVKFCTGDVLELPIDESCTAFAYVFRTKSILAWCGVLHGRPEDGVRLEDVAALVVEDGASLAASGWRPGSRAEHSIDLDALPYRCGKDPASLPHYSVADVARAVCGHMYWNMMGGFPSWRVSTSTPERAVLATDERWDEYCMLEFRQQHEEAYELRFTDHGWQAFQASKRSARGG